MGLLGGIIAGAMQGVGDAGQQITQQNSALMDRQELMRQQSNTDMAMAQQRSDLELQKQKALADYQETLKNAPLVKAGQYLKDAQSTTVPVSAAPVTELTQDSANGAGVETGFQGNAENMSNISTNLNKVLQDKNSSPEAKADAQAALDQLGKQVDAQGQANQAAVSGKTRPLTSDEAFAAALDKAKVNGDLIGLNALKSSIPDNLMILPDGATLIDKTTGKVIMSSTSKADRQEKHDLNIAKMKAEHDERMAALNKSDPEFIKIAKLAYGEGTPEYTKAIKDRVTKESGAVDTASIESNAQAIAAGKQSPPNLNSRSPQNAAIMARVREINPGYDQNLQAASAKAVKDFTTGKQGDQVRSFNTAIDHLSTIKEMANALNNKDTLLYNKLANFLVTQTGNAAVTNFETAKNLVGQEVVKAIVAGGGGEREREAAGKAFSANGSLGQISGAADTYLSLMSGQMHGLQQQYVSSNPNYVNNPELSDFARYLTPETRKITGIKSPEGKAENWATPVAKSPVNNQSIKSLPPGFILDK